MITFYGLDLTSFCFLLMNPLNSVKVRVYLCAREEQELLFLNYYYYYN